MALNTAFVLQVYFVAMVVDVVLRSFWVLSMSLGYFNRVNALGLSGALAVLEYLRCARVRSLDGMLNSPRRSS